MGEKLNRYEALNQWGAQDIMRTVLELSEDVYELVAFIEEAIRLRPASKKTFEWPQVLETQCCESAWARTDQTQDVEILKRLLALAAVDNQERSFWRWRKHIFESPELWRQLLG